MVKHIREGNNVVLVLFNVHPFSARDVEAPGGGKSLIINNYKEDLREGRARNCPFEIKSLNWAAEQVSTYRDMTQDQAHRNSSNVSHGSALFIAV